MSLTELLPSVQALPRNEKFSLMQELIVELAQEEGIPETVYHVWSPYDSYEAADTLRQLLEEEKAKRHD